MRKIQMWLTSCILLCMVLTGCANTSRNSPTPLGLVTSVDIVYDYRQTHLLRTYTETEKIDVILHYLHRLSPHGRVSADPEQLLGDSCKITVHLSDGTRHIYRMEGSRYLSVDYRPWQNISKERGGVLFHLIHHIESDCITETEGITKAGADSF